MIVTVTIEFSTCRKLFCGIQEFFKKGKLVTENDIKTFFIDGVNALCNEMRVLRDTMTEKTSLDVKWALLTTIQLIVAAVSEKDGVLPSLTENDSNIEKLQLLSATLPDEGPSGRRAVQLMAAEFIGTFHGLACVVHEASNVKAEELGSSLIMKLTKMKQQAESAWKDCSTDRVKMAIDILRALRTPEESNLTAESLVDGLQNLVKSATQVISTWKELKAAVIFTVSDFFWQTQLMFRILFNFKLLKDIQTSLNLNLSNLSDLLHFLFQQAEATELLTLAQGIDGLNIVDVRSLSYTSKDPKYMPTIAKDFPSLSDHSTQLQDLSHKSALLQDVINEVKNVNMEKEVSNYDKDWLYQSSTFRMLLTTTLILNMACQEATIFVFSFNNFF